MEQKKKKPSFDDIVKEIKDGEQADSELFAEQRSNILIVAGEHYTRRNSKYWNRLRDSRELSSEQKVRITKNHVQKIIKSYTNAILTYAPGTAISPRNETELQDIKAAQLNQSAWSWIKEDSKYDFKKHNWAKNYTEIGESVVKIFWDNTKGKLIGYEPETPSEEYLEKDEESGDKALPNKGKPIFAGGLVFEEVLPMNLIRPSDAKTIEDARWLAVKKMVSCESLLAKYGHDEEKKRLIEAGRDETFKVFDGMTGSYKDSEDECFIREKFCRPCEEYPMGYFYILTNKGILEEGELPLGIFPIHYVGWDAIQTTPRCRGHVKVIKPSQLEVNRACSKVAEHQITLGDDKLITQGNAKVSQGASVPGVRQVAVSGQSPPIIMPGRTGDQYLPYIEANIQEMYKLSFLDEDKLEKNGDLDPYAMLFKSLKQKKQFSLYVEKFERFLIDITSTSLSLFKEYANDYHIVPAIGKSELVNIEELKSTEDISFQIKIDAQVEDMETKMGKQLAFNHILQYVGPQLQPDQLGKIIRQMPYTNNEEAFGDLTIDYDNATNDILALDRGEMPTANMYDESKYIIKRLTHRMRQADFKFLPPEIQANYEAYKNQHEELEAQKMKEIQAAKADFIPSGGYLVACDIYISDPAKPEKLPKRARLPYESLSWLIERLENQGTSFDQLQSIGNQGAISEIAQKIQQGQPLSGQGGVTPTTGMAMPQGEMNGNGSTSLH